MYYKDDSSVLRLVKSSRQSGASNGCDLRTLMMATEMASETLVSSCKHLTWLIVREDFIKHVKVQKLVLT